MTETQPYLAYRFTDDDAFIQTFDEAPLWSAAFGLLLLRNLPIQHGITVVDIGSGTGFPLIELAGRLGNTSRVYGVDPWINANARAKQKISNYGYTNIELIESSAATLPFPDNTIDLIVSNLGINNVQDPVAVVNECNRVLKPGGKLALTTNLSGHWKECYALFYKTLEQIGKQHLIPALQADEIHRGTIDTVSSLFRNSGLQVNRIVEDQFEMTFADGTAFLNHHFVKVGWLVTWMELFPKAELPGIFAAFEQNLNRHAAQQGGLKLSVPMVYMEGKK